MGMFDRDREYGNRIDQQFDTNVPFLLLDAAITGETVETRFGDAESVQLTCQRIGTDGFAYGAEIICTTVASAIVAKVREAEPSDFPAVVELRRVPSKNNRGTNALVVQFLSPYFPGDAVIVTTDGSTRRAGK